MVIQSTQDYTLFKRIKGNRAVNKPHVSRLLEAIKGTPEAIRYNPIVINEKYEVIDGQHRLDAIQQLTLPVYYIKEDGLTLENVQSLNAMSKPWSPMDYARSFAELGNENYITYIAFKERFKLNHDILMRYLALDNPVTGTSFKAGMFKVMDVKLSEYYCQELLDIGQYYERYNIRSFALGLLSVMQSSEYDTKRMMHQMKKYGDQFQEQSLPNDYSRELERIYNFKRRDNIRLF